MKIHLQETSGNWKLFEGTLPELSGELTARNIRIGKWASIGESASIASQYVCVIISPLVSRQAPMTAYAHEKTIWIGTGCFLGSIEKFEAAVKATHAGTVHESEYMAAMAYVRAKIQIPKQP